MEDIVANKRGFVTVGASLDILCDVEKLWIMIAWTSCRFGRQFWQI